LFMFELLQHWYLISDWHQRQFRKSTFMMTLTSSGDSHHMWCCFFSLPIHHPLFSLNERIDMYNFSFFMISTIRIYVVGLAITTLFFFLSELFYVCSSWTNLFRSWQTCPTNFSFSYGCMNLVAFDAHSSLGN